jgi:hypothetical protein
MPFKLTNFVGIVKVDDVVKTGVQIVQQIHNLVGKMILLLGKL